MKLDIGFCYNHSKEYRGFIGEIPKDCIAIDYDKSMINSYLSWLSRIPNRKKYASVIHGDIRYTPFRDELFEEVISACVPFCPNHHKTDWRYHRRTRLESDKLVILNILRILESGGEATLFGCQPVDKNTMVWLEENYTIKKFTAPNIDTRDGIVIRKD